MVFDVTHYAKIQLDSVNVKKPLRYYNPNSSKDGLNSESVLLYVYDVYYENKYFMVLTDRLQVSFLSPKCVRFVDTKQGSCVYALKGMIDKIVERIRVNQVYADLFRDKSFHSCIDSLGNILTVRDMCEQDTVMFDQEGAQIPLDRLRYQDSVRLILYLKSVWINGKYFGLNLKISQIERLEPLGITRSLFHGPSDRRVCFAQLGSAPKLLQQPPPPPPPLPPGPLLRGKQDKGLAAKAAKVDKKNSEEEDADTVVIRPSLVDILNSRKKLRKTNILY